MRRGVLIPPRKHPYYESFCTPTYDAWIEAGEPVAGESEAGEADAGEAEAGEAGAEAEAGEAVAGERLDTSHKISAAYPEFDDMNWEAQPVITVIS